MRAIAIASVLVLSFIGLAMAGNPVAYQPGTGVPHGGQGGNGRSVVWSEPPDLNGMIASSEIVGVFGIVSETANDFVPADAPIRHATWWGGYFNTSAPCQGTTTPGFNLRFYADAGCAPGTVIADLSITQFTEESVGCDGTSPIYKWGTDVNLALTVGTKYWFGAQMKDHAFPPQAGRLASMGVVGCGSMYKSAFFGFPDWTLAEDVFGVAYDASQEFDGGPLPQACCFPDGHCEYTLADQCTADGGVPQGQGTTCDVNPCVQPTAACCFPDGLCRDLTQLDCEAGGGVWEGYGTHCPTYRCPEPLEACCFPDGHCENLFVTECEASGGIPEGFGSSCATYNCPQPAGACCLADGSCMDVTASDCAAHGGTWEGFGTHCSSFNCPQPPTGACCFGERCEIMTQIQCQDGGGAYQGDNTTCSPNNPCVISPTRPSSWGKIKGLYR